MTRRLFLCFAAGATLYAADPFFFIQMSDPQFGMQAENRDFAQETANFEFAIATANRLKPAFVIITGDLINRAGDGPQAAEFFRIASGLDPAIKLYNVPGNHDVGNDPTPDSLAAYQRRFGADHYSFQSNGLYGIVLNSSLVKSPDKALAAYEAQEQWLIAELKKAKAAGAKHIVVFQHHSWFLKAPEEADEYFNIPLERRRKYLALFHEYGVEAVFAGHYHRNAGGVDGTLEMVTTGPVGKPLEEGRSGIRIVIVTDQGIRHDYYDFSRLPNRVDLK